MDGQRLGQMGKNNQISEQFKRRDESTCHDFFFSYHRETFALFNNNRNDEKKVLI